MAIHLFSWLQRNDKGASGERSTTKASELVVQLLGLQKVHRHSVGRIKPFRFPCLLDHIGDVLPFRVAMPAPHGSEHDVARRREDRRNSVELRTRTRRLFATMIPD